MNWVAMAVLGGPALLFLIVGIFLAETIPTCVTRCEEHHLGFQTVSYAIPGGATCICGNLTRIPAEAP